MPYEWLRTAFELILARGIEPREVTQTLNGLDRRPVPVLDPVTGLRFLDIWGRTRSGRILIVTVRVGRDFEQIIVGARDVSDDERKEHERWEATR